MPDSVELMKDVVEARSYSALTAEAIAHLEELAHDILARIESHTETKGRLLDIGCGPGVLLTVARTRGWMTQGLELSQDSVARCRAARLEVISEPLERAPFDNGSFEAVVLHHVLEHVQDPNDTLRRCCSLLKPGGVLFVAVPNARSWRARIQGETNGYVYQRDHLLFFDPANLETLVIRHMRGPVSVETCRVGGRLGARIRRLPGGRVLQRAVENLGLGVEIRCWARKP